MHEIVAANAHEPALKAADDARLQVGGVRHVALEKVDKHFRAVEGGRRPGLACKVGVVKQDDAVQGGLAKVAEDVAHAQDVPQGRVQAVEGDQALHKKVCALVDCGRHVPGKLERRQHRRRGAHAGIALGLAAQVRPARAVGIQGAPEQGHTFNEA